VLPHSGQLVSFPTFLVVALVLISFHFFPCLTLGPSISSSRTPVVLLEKHVIRPEIYNNHP
jgi:hypothetical protein